MPYISEGNKKMRIEKELNEKISLEEFVDMAKEHYSDESKTERVDYLLSKISEILAGKGDVPTTFEGLFEFADLEEEDKQGFIIALYRFADENGYTLLRDSQMPAEYLDVCTYIEDKDQIFEYIFIKRRRL